MSSDWPVASALLVGRYRLVSLLETGGMAEIWRAHDELLDRPVAVKLPTGPQVVWREARMAARLSHPGIAAVHDYREAVRPDGAVIPFVVMELLEGESVAARVNRGPFGWAETARVGASVADALAGAHASGVVHRDIKPGNVMLTPNGVKILDFGISVAAGEPDDDDTGATFGTPAYVAPERLDGEPAEPATDVYGLGVLLFEMVTGDPPYPVDTWEELAAARVAGPSELPQSLPADFREVVDRCLNADPRMRPTAARLRADLLAVALRSRPGPEPDTEPESTADPSQPAGEPSQPADLPRPTPGQSPPAAGQSPPAGDHPGPASQPQRTADPSPLTVGRSEPDAGRRQPAAVPAGLSRTAATPRAAPKPRVSATPWPDLESASTSWSDAATARSGARSTAEEHSPGAGRRLTPTRPFATGRAPAATVAMTVPPRRRLAVGLSAAALAVAIGTAVAALTLTNRNTGDNLAGPPAATTAATSASASASAPAPATASALAALTTTNPTPTPTPSTKAAPSSPPPSARLTFSDAVSRLRTAIQDGSAAGEIRKDVATDLLNLLQNLSNANAGNVTAQIVQLRSKIQERASEGTVAAARATILQARLDDVDGAAGT